MAERQWSVIDVYQGCELEYNLPDGSAIDVVLYEYPYFSEYTWTIKIYDDETQEYKYIQSADMGKSYDNAIDAYQGLCDHIHINYSHLFADDPIISRPDMAREMFIQASEEYGFSEKENDMRRVRAIIYAWEFGESHVHDEVMGTRYADGRIVWDDPDFNPNDYDDEFYSVEMFDIH